MTENRGRLLFEEMYKVCKELACADKNHIWEHHSPKECASLNEIIDIQEKLKIKFGKEYADFLTYANGWACFYQMVDLFGTNDFEGEKMMYAKELLNEEIQNDDSLPEELLPIAVSREDMDLFVLVQSGEECGQIIWLAGGEIERFSTFYDFIEVMIEYNNKDLEDLV